MPYPATACAEFPNDNPELHDGACWVCESVCGRPAATAPRRPALVSPPFDDLDDHGADIAVADEADASKDASIVKDDAAGEVEGRYSRFVDTLRAIAGEAGDGSAVDRLVAALSTDPTARAWRAIILGESDDFASCGSKTLDEWAADLVARAITAPAKADLVRRELRARGVAAFGLVAA